MARKSVMVHDFSRIPQANIPRSTFSLSHSYKTTIGEAGPCYPILVQEVIPGDTHRVTAQILARLATPIKPIMDSLFAETFFFFCPNRLVWPNFLKFMGEQDNPSDSTDYTVPVMGGGLVIEGSLGDYMGLPLGLNYDLTQVSALPFRAWNKIFNQWFRAQDIVDSLPENNDDGPDMLTDYDLWVRGKRHDYFTSALPWPQFGPGVEIPISGDAMVASAETQTNNVVIQNDAGSGDQGRFLQHAGSGLANVEYGGATIAAPNLYADLSTVQAATINDLRQAFQIQKLQERDARGGHRYQELILSHFGVRGGDARLNRVEYLGGGTHPVGIVQIPQTAATVVDGSGGGETLAETPQGNLAAYGVVTGASGFTKSFTEHGYIIGIVNFRADLTYQKGLDRHWSRQTKYDFYWPALSKIGEMGILNKELFVQNNSADDEIFGYQERWSEMRHTNSKITGLFRSDAAASLDVWHLSQDFATLPALNEQFINDDPPVERVIAVQDEPHFLLDVYFNHKATRPMPVDGSPGYIDHF